MTAPRTGNRQRLPRNALRVCASCERPRGNVRKGWTQVTRDATVVGWTCPTCPRVDEPIRLANGRFRAKIDGAPKDGKRRQVSRTFTDLEAAREWVAETRAGLAAKGLDYRDPSTLTVRGLCERWLAARREEVGTPGGIREVTLNGYASALNAPLRHLGDEIAREVTPGQVEGMLRALATVGGKWQRPLSHRSIVYALTALRQAYNHGLREGWVTSNPALLARPPREVHSRREQARLRWTPRELVAFRTHVDGVDLSREPWLRAAMRLTLCGMRRSEVLGLDWAQVDLDAGTVEVIASRVRTGRGTATVLGAVKTANSLRTIQVEVIHPGTAAALRALWLAQGRPEDGLVIRDAVGQPVAPDRYSARFRDLCAEADLPVLRAIHNVRHTLATALKSAEVPDHEAAALFGHDVDTFRRFYLVTDDDGAASAAEAAGRLFAV